MTGFERNGILGIGAILAIALVMAGIGAAAVTDYATLAEITSTNFLPQAIHPGDTISMAVAIKNRGSAIDIVDMNASIGLDNQFEPISLSDSVDIVKPGSTKSVVFRFRAKDSTPPGYYQVFLNIEYLRDGRIVSQRVNIPVPISATQKNLEVNVTPRSINPGNQSDMTFTLRNVGGAPVSNISFAWSEKGSLVLPLGTDNKRYVDSLNAGEEQEIGYIVAADPNIAPGIYPLDITVSFTDFNGTKTQNSQVGLIIGGGTDFEVGAELTQAGQLSLSIANIGSNNAGAVVVKIPEQPGISVSGSSESIIGNLNKGDFSLANFTVRQQSGDQNSTGMRRNIGGQAGQGSPAAGQEAFQGTQTPYEPGDRNQGARQARTFAGAAAGSLRVEISYTDTTGVRQAVAKSIRLNPAAVSGSGAIQSGTVFARQGGSDDMQGIAVVLLVLLVAGGAAYNHYHIKAGWRKVGTRLGITMVLFLAAILVFRSSLVAVAVATIVSSAALATAFMEKKDK